jgi:hypothetical protein
MNIHSIYRTFIAFVSLLGIPTQSPKTLVELYSGKTH